MPQIDIAILHSVLFTTYITYFTVYTLFNWGIITKLNYGFKKIIKTIIYTVFK